MLLRYAGLQATFAEIPIVVKPTRYLAKARSWSAVVVALQAISGRHAFAWVVLCVSFHLVVWQA